MPHTAPIAHPATGTPPRKYSTETTAYIFGVKSHSLHVALSKNGSYYGIRPVKLPNRRLLWPADQVDAVARGETAPAGGAE